MADGYIQGDNLICGLHGWDYRYDTGVSEYNNEEVLYKFKSEIVDGYICVDEEEINEYLVEHPQPFNRDEYQGQYADTHPETTEPYTGYIKHLSKHGLKKYGHHGPSASMGVDRNLLPKWENIQPTKCDIKHVHGSILYIFYIRSWILFVRVPRWRTGDQYVYAVA